MIFLKLGGSLITDKTRVESLRKGVLQRIAQEIGRAFSTKPDLQLVIGHGGGSFGHVAAAQYNTRAGVNTRKQWQGFAVVSDAAARLNKQVRVSLLGAGVPAITFQPSASAVCEDGKILVMEITPIRTALEAGLVPLVYGDVAVDGAIGGTIISTEEILSFIAAVLKPDWLLFAGETNGVNDAASQIVPTINRSNLKDLDSVLKGSRGTDVTGGMDSKVRGMVELVEQFPNMKVRLFSGLVSGQVESVLLNPDSTIGTVIQALKK
jgi:isopentenyl phosphate kinase